MFTRLSIALALSLAPACLLDRSTTNERPEPAALHELTPGTTTASDVVRLLGAPSEVVQLGKRSAYRYEHSVTKRTGLWLIVFGSLNSDTQSDRVWVFFDENAILTHVASTFESERAEFGMAWTD
ncbi:MAG: outer membrane protein assembly factor BamE [Planctomycetes bacterium]|nr:outer membrane protein assembly factor BamE [Planctomycetota bacterium]